MSCQVEQSQGECSGARWCPTHGWDGAQPRQAAVGCEREADVVVTATAHVNAEMLRGMDPRVLETVLRDAMAEQLAQALRRYTETVRLGLGVQPPKGLLNDAPSTAAQVSVKVSKRARSFLEGGPG